MYVTEQEKTAKIENFEKFECNLMNQDNGEYK